jgi:hypothetical protein
MAAMLFTPDLATQLYASLLCLAIVTGAYFARRKFAPSPGLPVAEATQRTLASG